MPPSGPTSARSAAQRAACCARTASAETVLERAHWDDRGVQLHVRSSPRPCASSAQLTRICALVNPIRMETKRTGRTFVGLRATPNIPPRVATPALTAVALFCRGTEPVQQLDLKRNAAARGSNRPISILIVDLVVGYVAWRSDCVVSRRLPQSACSLMSWARLYASSARLRPFRGRGRPFAFTPGPRAQRQRTVSRSSTGCSWLPS
jgi:hypothetical protein